MPFITTSDTVLTLPTGDNLLDALERSGHDVHYQCRSGYCGSCRLKLLAGRVSYAEPPMALMLPGDILPCCCQVTEDIRIECRLRQPESHDFGYDGDLFDPW